MRNDILFEKPLEWGEWKMVSKSENWEEYEDYRHRNTQARMRGIQTFIHFSDNHKNPIPKHFFRFTPSGDLQNQFLSSCIISPKPYAKDLTFIRRIQYQKVFNSYLQTLTLPVALASILKERKNNQWIMQEA